MDKRIVFVDGICLSIGIVLFLYGWSLGFSRYAFWFEFFGLTLSAIGFVVSFYGATTDLVKLGWVDQEIAGYQKLIFRVLAYFGLVLGLLVVLLVIVATALILMNYF